uniref:Uncharacterized protein n=1 Tax=Anguilla anguilla TaxID=7936 RepID=A0A0E9QPH8_ANGAN
MITCLCLFNLIQPASLLFGFTCRKAQSCIEELYTTQAFSN